MKEGGQTAITAWGVPLTVLEPSRLVDLCGEDGAKCVEGAQTVWGQIQQAAEEAYDRTSSCSMTTFVGYEWSANSVGSNG